MNRALEMNSMENAKDVWLSNGLGVGLWYRFYSVDHVHSNSFRLRKSFFVRALRFVKIWHKTDQENHFSYLNPFDLVLSKLYYEHCLAIAFRQFKFEKFFIILWFEIFGHYSEFIASVWFSRILFTIRCELHLNEEIFKKVLQLTS